MVVLMSEQKKCHRKVVSFLDVAPRTKKPEIPPIEHEWEIFTRLIMIEWSSHDVYEY